MEGRAVLLVNLGSPDSPSVSDVRRYLNQFLMDKYVIDLPYLLRRLIVSCFVLPRRPKQSAGAYASIWWPEGSPLKVLTERLTEQLANKTRAVCVRYAMRYGSPSIEQELISLASRPDVTEILVVPLYPHYAMSTVKTCVVELERITRDQDIRLPVYVHPVFYEDEAYIGALYDVAKPFLQQSYDHLLFSYHGVPERHIRKDDPTGSHCLSSADCCQQSSVAHLTCYRAQVLKTTAAFVAKAGIEQDKYSVAFQSRLGKAKWLEPYTNKQLVSLAEQGVKKLLVMCPAFVSDCLETLEEIAIQGEEIFKAAGGESLTLIPCLNDHETWAEVLAAWWQKSPAKLSRIKG
ncbi:ferrochelatase [Zooshikella ganghwensis]|uniref:ferrochelatase n=1 Tax=Zooshikella ganghwensis TaxID=202772 RepID=UPI000410EA6A|nr:ferrochelatase [Zooshikella ganghwensis]